MDKRIPMTAMAVALAAASTGAMATDQGAIFINGNLGQSTYHDSGFNRNTDTSASLRAGYSWQSYLVDFGVEAGYVDLGQASADVALPSFGNRTFTAHGKGPLLGANIRYKFRNRMFVSARGGWFRSTLDASVSGIGSQSYRGNGAYVGVGVGYDITPQFSLGVGFDDYHGRVSVNGTRLSESVGVYAGFAEYRF